MRRTFQTNFTSGELDPQFLARMDLTQYQNGAEKVRNFLPLPQGGVERRPGLEFIDDIGTLAGLSNPAVDTPRLVQFTFSIDQVYMFILSDQRIDIFRDDVLVASLTTGIPWRITELSELTWRHNLDTIIFFHQKYPMLRIMRQGSDTAWDVADWEVFNLPKHTFSNTVGNGVDATIEIDIPSWASGQRITMFLDGVETDVITGQASVALNATEIETALRALSNAGSRGLELLLNGSLFVDEEFWTYGVGWTVNPSGPYTFRSSAAGPGPTVISQPVDITVGVSYVVEYTLRVMDGASSAQIKVGGTAGVLRTSLLWTQYQEVIVAGAGSLFEIEGTNNVQVQNVTLKKAASVTVVSAGGTKYTASFSAEMGSKPWSIIAGNTSFDNAAIEVSVLDVIKGEKPTEDAWSDARGYPRCGVFFQGRLWVAGSTDAPLTVWASRIDDFNDFDNSSTGDTWGISETVAVEEASAINQMHVGGHLQIFTSSKEYYIPISEDTLVTPGNVAFKMNSERGSKAGIQIIGVDGASIFVQHDGQAVRSFIFDDRENKYVTESVSLFSSHLLVNPVDVAFRRAVSTSESDFIYVINGDGTLAILSFMRVQDINAWSLQTTQGDFLSAEVTNTTAGRISYFLVRRLVDGSPVIYFEKFNPKLLVDSGVFAEDLSATYPTSSSISWLDQVLLEIYVDGVIEPQQRLPSAGPTAVVFSNPAEDSWQVGFPFPDVKGDGSQTWLKTMPFVAETSEGISAGKKIRIVEVTVRMLLTASLAVQGNELAFRHLGDELLDQPIAKFTGDKVIKGLRGWSTLGQVDITQSHSLPATVLGLGMKASI